MTLSADDGVTNSPFCFFLQRTAATRLLAAVLRISGNQVLKMIGGAQSTYTVKVENLKTLLTFWT